MRVGVMWAQRRAHLLPAPVRRAAGRVLRRSLAEGAGVALPSEDWSVPLIAGRGAPGLCEAEPVATPQPTSPLAAPAPRAASTPGARLRVVIATDILDVGGAEEFAAFLARGLPQLGFDVVVTYASTHLPDQAGAGGRIARQLMAEGIETVHVTPDMGARFLQDRKPDLISSHYGPRWLLEAAQAAGVPWVETLHGMHWFMHEESWARSGAQARAISAQVAVSDLVRRQYLELNPEFPADRVALADRTTARHALGLDDEFLFVSLARYCLQKNTYGLISAFAEVARHEPRAHLLLAGRADDLPYYAQVRQLAADVDCADRIHVRGHCGQPAALLAAADAFVQDSFFEGWSLASLEATASGLPVVLSDVGGAREQLTVGERRGYLVANPTGDTQTVTWTAISDHRFRTQANRAELVAAMSAAIADQGYWQTQRARLRQDALSHFSSDRCLVGHAEVLRAVAAGTSLPRGASVAESVGMSTGGTVA